MIRSKHTTRAIALTAMLLSTTVPIAAHAGDRDRANVAISEAKGKIDAGDKVGASTQAPELQAQAREALMSAEAQLANGKKKDAIATAHHASELADQAITSADNRKTASERDRRHDAQDAAIAAQAAAANANARADNARQSVSDANGRADMAQQSANAANMRADASQQAAVNATAQADMMRNMQHPVPAPSTTTVAVTEHDSMMASAAPTHRRHRVTHKRAHRMHSKTTTVTTTHP